MRPHQGDWLSLEDHTDCRSLVKDPSLWRSSKWFLTLLTDDADTVTVSRWFHMLMIRSLKKYCHKSSIVRFLAIFREWPLVRLYVENSIDDNPWIILNTSIRSALVRLSSKKHKFSCLWSPYVIGQTIIFSSCFFFLLSSSSFFSSPNLSGRRLDVYHTSAHGVVLV